MSKTSAKLETTSTQRYWLLGIFALALILRLWGIQHDLPFSYYPDESHFVKRGVSFGSGDLNPHWFHKPALFMYLLFVEYGLCFAAGWVLGLWTSTTDYAVQFVRDPSMFYVIGRLTVVAFSMASIWGAYRIGEKHFGKNVGLVAALLIGLSYTHINSSQVVKADVPATCFGIWSMYFLMNYMKDGRPKGLVLACVLAGMGWATKYYAIVMLLPIGLAVLLAPVPENARPARPWARRLALLGLALAVFWGTCFVCAPYNFLDPLGRESTLQPFHHAASLAYRLTGREYDDAPVAEFQQHDIGMVEAARHYGAVLASGRGMGPVIAVLCLFGFVAVVASRETSKILFALYPAAFILASIAGLSGEVRPRHQCPLYPFLTVAAGYMIVHLAGLAGRRQWLVYASLAIALYFPASGVVARALDVAQQDTRNAAKAWIEEHVPAGARIVIDEEGPNLLTNEKRLAMLAEEAEEIDGNGQFTTHYSHYLKYQRLAAGQQVAYELYEIRIPWWRGGRSNRQGTHVLDSEYDRDMANPARPVGVESYDFYCENGLQFAVVNSTRYARYFREKNNASDLYPAMSEFYRELFRRGRLVKEFTAEEDGLRGPVVRVYAFDSEGSQE